MTTSGKNPVILGRVSGLYGVKGWFKVHSYADPREGIFQYSRWLLRDKEEWREVTLAEGKKHGKTLIAHIAEVTDRDTASALVGQDIAVPRENMPDPASGEYYWHDLEGLEVVDSTGSTLGRVDHLLATGANDVLVVKGEQEVLVPFLLDEVIRDVDFDKGVISVAWDWE